MYKLQKEKREEEIAIKNIEKAKNEYVTPQSFEKMLNETQNIKNVEEDKNNSSSSFSYRDYFYNLSKKYFTKLENSKVGIAVSQGINKVNQKISLSSISILGASACVCVKLYCFVWFFVSYIIHCII